MFIAMNRFRINAGFESAFEDIWRNRESRLKDMAGFRSFHLLRGASDGQITLYASHTIWESERHFDDWRQSDAFVKAHSQAKAPQGTYAGPPQFEGFTAVIEEV